MLKTAKRKHFYFDAQTNMSTPAVCLTADHHTHHHVTESPILKDHSWVWDIFCKTILWHFQFHVLTPSQLNFFAQVFVFLFFRAYFWKFLWWMIFINECRGDWPYCFQKLLLQKQLSFLQTLKWSVFDLFWKHTLMRLKIVE